MAQDDNKYTYFPSWMVGGSDHGDLETPGDLANRDLNVEKEKLQNKSKQQHGKGSD